MGASKITWRVLGGRLFACYTGCEPSEIKTKILSGGLFFWYPVDGLCHIFCYWHNRFCCHGCICLSPNVFMSSGRPAREVKAEEDHAWSLLRFVLLSINAYL